jgi:hypothetical protein
MPYHTTNPRQNDHQDQKNSGQPKNILLDVIMPLNIIQLHIIFNAM